MAENTIDFESYRRHCGEKSRNMWRLLNLHFDKLGIPGSMRHGLMFMPLDTYLAWGREEYIVPREKIELAVKYTQLCRTAISFWGDENIAHQWLFSGNNGYKSLYKARSPIETILEDGERVIEDITATLRQP